MIRIDFIYGTKATVKAGHVLPAVGNTIRLGGEDTGLYRVESVFIRYKDSMGDPGSEEYIIVHLSKISET